MPTLPEQLKGLVDAFQKQPSDIGERDLRRLRLEMAHAWAKADLQLATRMSQTEMFAAGRVLRASGLRNLEILADERDAFGPWQAILSEHWPSPELGGMMMACSLFLPAHELCIRPEIEGTPMWLLEDYVEYLFDAPTLLLRPGESVRYVRHLESALGQLDPAIDTLGAKVEEMVIRHLNVIQAYFNDENLRGLMALRARLLEGFLTRRGFVLDQTKSTRLPGRLRVGFLAPAYLSQTEGAFALANLTGLDRQTFEIFLYGLHSAASPIETACRSHADHFIVLPPNLPQQVATLRANDLDLMVILTNIGAVTNQIALIAAHRLARTQVASMATPVTTGFSRIDAFLSSQDNDGEDAQSHYTERLIKIEGSLNHYAFTEQPPSAAVPSRASLGIPPQAVVFFSALNFYKIIPEIAARWAEILNSVPESVLVLLPFNPNWSSSYPEHAFRRRIERELGSCGVASSRIQILAPVPTRGDVVALMRLADIYLDGYPFAGACSIYDPLMAGLAPVAREGTTARSRHGAIMLRMFGLDELVTQSDDDYVKLAVSLGNAPDRRARLRTAISEAVARNNPVLDCADFGRRLMPVLQRLAEGKESATVDLHEALSRRSQRIAQCRVKTLTDNAIVSSVLLPCFSTATPTSPLHLVDVGACYGQMAMPFLKAGWTADLFEPDPSCRKVLERALAPFARKARLHPMAVSDQPGDATPFYKAATDGLSGLGPSPYGDTAEVIHVPTVRLGEHLRACGTTRIDLLKVDTEGQDFKVLASHDFGALPPRFVLIEVNSAFAEHGWEQIRDGLAAMRARGYAALVLRYEDDGTFKQGIWDRYWLKDIRVVRELSADQVPIMANVVFYRDDDGVFIERLLLTLDNVLATAA